MNILQIILLGSLLLFAPLLPGVLAAPPAISRQMELVEATIEGGSIATIDPAASYDSASAELLMNMYDTLVFFDGERLDRYLPQLADNWTIENITGTTSPDGLSWYYRYTFHIRPNVHFWDGSTLTPEDVEYCFERGMVLEPGDNPQWMFYEPLLNTWGADGLNTTTLDGNAAEQARVGSIINHSVESNSTHVLFNLAFPGAYSPLMKILSQQWSSIYSKAWALGLGRPNNWDGNWSDWYSHWLTMQIPYPNTPLPPFDDPTPVAMGTGPFVLEELSNYPVNRWSGLRNHDYWRGWPVDWPAFGSSGPAGYIERFVVTWAYDWNTRSTMFLNGEVDICAVPRQYQASIMGQPGIRFIYPLSSLAVNMFVFRFDINPTSPYGPILPSGTFNETGVPSDFFGNASWGVHVRKAFSYAIDYEAFLEALYPGDPTAYCRPATAIVPALPYYSPSVSSYYFNLNKTVEELQQVPGLWDTGFTIKFLYTVSSLVRPEPYTPLAQAINSLNPKFHCSAQPLDWRSYLSASTYRWLPAFLSGWLMDYPDPHNFALPYYHSSGLVASRCSYNNSVMDALIDQGIGQLEGPVRSNTYALIQQLAVDDCPSTTMYTPQGRFFERTWVCGWYYNPAYPGVYAANLWKWYYTPHAQQDNITNTTTDLLPHDVNCDGKTDMYDIGVAAASFGSVYGPPISAKWNYRCDFNNDRKNNMKDIAACAKNFGKTSAVWAPTV